MQVAAQDAVQTGGFLALGMRRLAADLAFIRLLIYYGTPETDGSSTESHVENPHEHHEFGGGHYPELQGRALQIVRLDPYFSYGTLYAAGALAFNLDRPDEALLVLRDAAALNPWEWKLKAYMAGIGFHKIGNAQAVLQELTPILTDPDCPVMLKNMLAFLNRKTGHTAEAIRIYRDILQSRDASYHDIARKALRELGSY